MAEILNTPRVDVVIPCYNYAKYLEYCVETVLSQRDVEVRVLILDDCSPDNTPEVGQRLAASDNRVTYSRNASNLGLVGTANRGVIEWATAPYTLLLSADDALTPGALARSTEVMERNPEIGMTYGMAVVVNEINDEYPAEDQDEFDFRKVSGKRFIERFCRNKNPVASPTALVRTSTQKAIGGYNPDFPHTCDVEMWMRFATQSDIGVVNAPQAYYRWHDNNMSSKYISQPMGDLREQFASEAFWLAGIALQKKDKNAAKECLKFALDLRPDYWKLRSWWVYQAKRLLGARSYAQIQLWSGRSNTQYQPFTHGAQFGWWPDSE